MKAFVIGSVDRIPNCCGVIELGEFMGYEGTKTQVDSWINTLPRSYYGAKGRCITWETDTELVEKLTQLLRSFGTYNAAFYQAWFVNDAIIDDDTDELTGEYAGYDCNEVRIALSQLPNVVHLGEAINPNTNNLIDGYLWKAFK